MYAQDHPLLLGLFALEQEFVSAAELIDAFRTWRDQPDGSIAQILASRGKLSQERVRSLEQLVPDSLRKYGGLPKSSTDGSPTTTWRTESTSAADIEIALPIRVHQPASNNSAATGSIEPETANPRYKALRLHARGGLGHVFLAEDLELHRQVALKEIREDAADEPTSRHRFLAEAKITGNLEHPGIVPIYGLGVHADGRPYYAMRFIQGQTLGEAIKKFHADGKGDFKTLEFRQLLGRVISVCNAVAFAHSRSIVHRDLKPQNVMLGPFGETLVVDWGLARSFHVGGSENTMDWQSQWPRPQMPTDRESVTSQGEIVGTPAYMSPEQATGRGDAIGPLSDVYAIGAILYFLIAGKSPLHGNTSDIVEAVKQGNIVPLRQANPRVPRSLAAICQKAMAHQPPQRYASALALAADIERWLADESVEAYAEPWIDSAFRWMRKNRLPVAIVGIGLLVTSVTLTIGYALVRNERNIAQRERENAVAANRRAQENAAATRQVIEQFLIQIADDRWSQLPGFENVRLDMVRLAVDRYHQLLRQQPDDDSLAADAAMALRRCANLYRMLGRYAPAEGLYDDSLALLRKTAAAGTEQSRSERMLCETLIDRALLIMRTKGVNAAENPMREALLAGKQAREHQPTSAAAAQAEARAQQDLASLLRDQGQFDEAIRLLGLAEATMRRNAQRYPQALVNRLSAAFAGVDLVQALRESGRAREALAILPDTIRRTETYLQLTPLDPNMRYIATRAGLEQAILHHQTPVAAGDPQTEFNQAIAQLDQLTTEFPSISSYRRKLAEGLMERGNFLLTRGNLAEAASDSQRSTDLLERLDREAGQPAYLQPILAAAHTLAGEVELKKTEIEQLLVPGWSKPCGFSRCALESSPGNPLLHEEKKRIDALLSTAADNSSTN